MKIAALLTCHNRKDQTLACLENLLAQSIDIYLVDDGSTDGTASAVEQRYPEANLIHGDGSLYWTGGMRLALQAASTGPYDFFLWLNDDTRLYTDAIARLLQTYHKLAAAHECPIIVVASILDPDSGALSYGGSVHSSRWLPLRFRRIHPAPEPQRCDVFNGNCVLLPRQAVEVVGNLHPKLVHAAGDYEYGLRAGRKNVTSWIAPGFFGECERNSSQNTWKDPSLSLIQRYKLLFSKKGQPPLPRLIYYYNYGGPFWFALYPLVYFRPIADSLRRTREHGTL